MSGVAFSMHTIKNVNIIFMTFGTEVNLLANDEQTDKTLNDNKTNDKIMKKLIQNMKNRRIRSKLK